MAVPPAEARRRAALNLAERLHRAALAVRAAGDPYLGESLAAAAVALPAAARGAEVVEVAVARAAAAVELAHRLGLLPEGPGLLAGLEALAAGPPAPAAAPAPPPPARKAPPAAPPPPSAAARDHLLVDACNVLGQTDSLGDEAARERLITRLQDYAHRHPGARVAAVFDGKQTTSRTAGGVEIKTTGSGRTADDALVDSLRALSAAERRRAVVVTDDRELGSRVRALGGRAEPVAWLVARLKEPTARIEAPLRADGLPRREVAEWEEYFSRPPQRPGSAKRGK